MNLKSITLVLLFCLWTCFAQGQTDPNRNWKQIRTEHFDIFFPEELSDTALRYSGFAEQSRLLLSDYFSELPKKTAVVIDDSFDLANGSATRIPYPLVFVYPVLPGPLTSISEYGNWGLELFVHEYAHIASFEPTRGIVTPLRWIFGSVITPNIMLPLWWLEGIAVEMETRFSHHGRLVSSYQEASLRAMVLDNTLRSYSLAEINETSIPTWPGGARPYLFGSLLWSELIQESGPRIVDDLHQSYGGRIPYILNPPLQRLTGQNYPSLFDNTIERTESRVKKQLASITEPSLTETPEFLSPLLKETVEYQTQKPAISPDGRRMVLIAQRRLGKYRLIHLERKSKSSPFQIVSSKDLSSPDGQSGDSEDSPTGTAITRVSWLPDSSAYVFDRVQSVDRFRQLSDLYQYDWKKGKIKRLTKELRAREPAISEDGKKMVFVKIHGDYTALATYDLKEKSVKTLYSPEAQVRVSYPSFINDDQILFAERNPSGNEQIRVFSISTGDIETLAPDHNQAQFPIYTSEGILFSSRQNGINNLFVLGEDGTSKPITNSQTGVFLGEFDPLTSDIYTTEMSARGFTIKRLTPTHRYTSALSPVPSLYGDTYKDPKQVKAPSTQNLEVQDYSVGSYILPNYWLPFIYQDETGMWGASITTGGQDPLGRHQYALQLALDPQTQKLDHAVSYTNATRPTLTHLAWATEHQQILGTDIVIMSNLGSILFDKKTYFLDESISTSFGWQYLNRAPIGDTYDRSGPTLSLGYSTLTQERGENVPNSGWSAQMSYIYYLPGFGEMDYQSLLLHGSFFHSNRLPQNHSLGVQFLGSYTDREIPVALSTPSRGVDLQRGPMHRNLLMRGYLSYQFFGSRYANTHIEYYFPISDLHWGSGTLPFFFHQIHGSIFIDNMILEGSGYQPDRMAYRPVKAEEIITSIGAEAYFDGTFGYKMPVSILLGVYYGLSEAYSDGPKAFFGLQL